MYLLDTNICAYLMKGSFPALSRKVLTVDPSQLAVSSVTVFDLYYGAAKGAWGERNMQRLRVFLSSFQVLPFGEADAIAAGQIRAELRRLGRPIGSYDVQIAAQGVARGLTVVTHNVSEFARVPGIRLEDWTEES